MISVRDRYREQKMFTLIGEYNNCALQSLSNIWAPGDCPYVYFLAGIILLSILHKNTCIISSIYTNFF